MVRRPFRRASFAAVVLLLASFWSASASDLRIEHVQFIAPQDAPGPYRALVDVSWRHAWRSPRNHDAAWIFLKLVRPGGGYAHVRLAPEGHRAVPEPDTGTPAARLDVVSDGAGLFLSTNAPYRGDVRWRLDLRIDASGLDEALRDARLEAYGIEMVYVPEGPFTLGDPDTTALGYGAFFRAGAGGAPDGLFAVDGEAALAVGPGPGALYYRADTGYEGDRAGPVPAAFPKGYRAFYAMKYEVTQGQYAAFLNTLSDAATYERVNFMGRTYYAMRGTIRLEDGRYVAGRPDRPLNFAAWDDQLAFADWAALRPMTELEFTKAARGPEEPAPGAFPWGTADRTALARVVGPDDDLVMTNGWDERRLTDATRGVFGASYYWVMDLAGSVWERVVSLGSPDGRAFEGSHGDGRLGAMARATNADWPHTYEGREGHGYRGGGYYHQGMSFYEFNPYSPVAYRRFGGWAGAYPAEAYGFRAVRTAAP